jgi:biopolymer transport protein ExbB/TolQ
LFWLVVGAALMTGPYWGLLGTALGMYRSFFVLERLNAPSPADLQEGVQLSLYSTVIGIGVGALGMAICAVALARFVGRRDGFGAGKPLEA